MNLRPIAIIGLLAGLTCPPALASTMEEVIHPIQDEWAVIKYRTPEKLQVERYQALAERARGLVEANPGKAEPLVWAGIVLSSEAGAKGGLGALSLAKQAKQQLEEAMKLDDKALKGSSYTSLGTLYYKVPGWPIGFGDKKKAEALLKKALVLNPEGIDPNFFYGEYLLERDHPAEALRYLETALKAAPRPGRELADAGRRQEIQALIVKTRKELDN
jgi:tetratricopeptide (TPR) repeat protein